jgi:hypothetical protein
VTDYYVDASALVKRYADESGSIWVRQITDPSTRHSSENPLSHPEPTSLPES